MGKKELLHTLVDKVPDTRLVEVINFLLFIQSSQQSEYADLLSATESNLSFWDTEEDEVWNNV